MCGEAETMALHCSALTHKLVNEAYLQPNYYPHITTRDPFKQVIEPETFWQHPCNVASIEQTYRREYHCRGEHGSVSRLWFNPRSTRASIRTGAAEKLREIPATIYCLSPPRSGWRSPALQRPTRWHACRTPRSATLRQPLTCLANYLPRVPS